MHKNRLPKIIPVFAAAALVYNVLSANAYADGTTGVPVSATIEEPVETYIKRIDPASNTTPQWERVTPESAYFNGLLDNDPLLAKDRYEWMDYLPLTTEQVKAASRESEAFYDHLDHLTNFKIYTVKKGNTLFRIWENEYYEHNGFFFPFTEFLKEVKTENPQKRLDNLMPGDDLYIPYR